MLRKDVQELIAALRKQYEQVREKQEFLKLKQQELRPDDGISFFWFLETKQNFAMEQSLLIGHALMIQQDIQKKHIVLSRDDQTFLEEIVSYLRSIPVYS